MPSDDDDALDSLFESGEEGKFLFADDMPEPHDFTRDYT